MFGIGYNSVVVSPMNYIGGKRKLLNQIVPLFPQNISTFIDLFCGGCSIGINVDAQRVIFNDNLTYLIDMYKSFLDLGKDYILSYIDTRIAELELSLTNKEGFLKLRSEYNSTRNPLDLFILIAFSFNHQIRFNSKHEYNNPFGQERSCYNPKMRANLASFIDALRLKDVVFTDFDFRNVDYSGLKENDFVYADPPYLITRGTYNDGKRGFTGWGNDEEKALLAILTSLDEKGCRFALSNVITHKGLRNALLEEWIEKNQFRVNYLDKNYRNSNYQTANFDRGQTLEVLVTNYRINNEIYWK